MFTAVCLSSDSLTKSGLSEEQALRYIESRSCVGCVEDANRGFVEDDFGKELINDILDTTCGAEWLILED